MKDEMKNSNINNFSFSLVICRCLSSKHFNFSRMTSQNGQAKQELR